MRKMIKTASGTVMHDSSAASIEQVLVNEMAEALGDFRNVVKIKPYLRVDSEDADASGNVNNAFGAIELNVHGAKLFIPFIIAEKKLLPFDTIRMGEQETSYDYSKLRKIVNTLDHKARSKQDESEEGEFKTMEVADFDDLQFNNGFLGTIMNVRDHHKAKDIRGESPWEGDNFGVFDDQRLLQKGASSEDVLDNFHDVMEKVANVTAYTQEQLDSYAEHLQKEAEKEEAEMLEKTAAEDTMEEARVRRDMVRLSEEKLVNVHRVASGNNIAFPTFQDSRFQYRMGRVYRQFESWFKKDQRVSSSKIGGLVIDTHGGYRILKNNEPFMASTREPGDFKLKTDVTRSLKVKGMYTAEMNESTLLNPFYIESSYLDDRLNEGLIVSVRERATGEVSERSGNSLFRNAFECKEFMPSTTQSEPRFFSEGFTILCSKDPSITEPVFMKEPEQKAYIAENAKDAQDASLARAMLMYHDNIILVPQDFSFFKMEKKIEGYYTRPDGIFKEGPLAKQAAYEGQNKATLIVKSDREPKQYAVHWKFAKDDEAAEGVKATNVQKRFVDDLSKDQAQSILNKLGFDHRTQARFFEIADRNGRNASFNLPDPSKAENVSGPDAAGAKVKEKMKGIANSMLHSKNFMPLMANNVADGLSAAISSTVPGSVEAAHKVGEFFGSKEAMETALAFEKQATDISGSHWHEISALLNMKYRLDKLAESIDQGAYLHNAEPVFEKVATLKPTVEQKTRDLIQFNRDQLMKTSSYLVDPGLIKQAIHQLDGLYAYAASDIGKKKERNEFSLVKMAARKFNSNELIQESRGHIQKLQQHIDRAKNHYEDAQARLRSVIDEGQQSPNVQRAQKDVQETQRELSESTEKLQSQLHSLGDHEQKRANRTLAGSAAVGVPGLMGLSYGYASAKDKE